MPNPNEIELVDWFHPDHLPSPLTFVAPHTIADAVADLRKLMCEINL